VESQLLQHWTVLSSLEALRLSALSYSQKELQPSLLRSEPARILPQLVSEHLLDVWVSSSF